MSEQKWVDFDYQRYLDGDEVFLRKGEKFEGEIFYSEIRKKHHASCTLAICENTGYLTRYEKNGRFYSFGNNGIDLVMKPKVKKLFIRVSKYALSDGTTHYASNAVQDKAELLLLSPEELKNYEIIEIELEQ